jgi:hypothetical protein
MRRRFGLSLTLGTALALGACVANTPQQDLAYTRWATCSSPYVQLQRIDVDGRITFQHAGFAGRDEVFRCLAQASAAGPALPPPQAIGPPGGP